MNRSIPFSRTGPSIVLALWALSLEPAHPAPTPGPSPAPTLAPLEERLPYSVTVLPNPVRGRKVTFRVQTDRPIKVRVRVYDRFLDKVIDLEKEGDKLFDLLWTLKQVPEGIYYFQAQVIDPVTEAVTPLAPQKFLILKGSSSRTR